MTETNTTDAQRTVLIQRAWVAISVIQSMMHNKEQGGQPPHWQSLVTYLERAADCASNLDRERVSHANEN